ncbi:O-antigen ligase family protein [Flagellimonas sp. 389]|uniref:O-antigen ligase family protein n=1 Tax=Flagellimonas sp. 389 TaxID=2835862 RepID=UPI001BD53B12|nr:O-antigen ligase family protein [Flagellimonas sp. 389]MBS9461266.1 O-antigen ligase family protein [Flagellimonas sp. 389]
MKALLNSKNNYLQLPTFLLHAIFFLIPFGGKIIPPLIILLVITVLVFCNKGKWVNNFTFAWEYHYPLILLFILYLIGIFWSDNIPNALTRIEHTLSFIIFPLIIPAICLTKGQVLKLFRIFVYGCLVVLLTSFLDFAYVTLTTDEYIILGEIPAGNRPGSVYEYLSQHFLIIGVHRTYFSMYLTVCVSYLLFHFEDYIFIFKRKIKWVGYLSIFIILTGLILVQSKAGWVLSSAIICFFLVVSRNNWRRSAIFLLIFALISLGSLKSILDYRFKPMMEEIQNILSPGDDGEKNYAKNLRPGSTEIRYMVFKSSFQLIYDSPLFGYGTGDVKDVIKKQNETNGFKSISHLNYGPHSQFLSTLLSFGIFGFLIFLGVFFLPIYDTILRTDFFVLSVLFTIFLNCSTESILSRQEGIVCATLFITIFGILKRQERIVNNQQEFL